MWGTFSYYWITKLIYYLIEQLPMSSLNPSLYVPIIYTIFGVIIYILSFFISVFIYHKKEF